MYKLTILSSKDFDSLPESVTRGSDISMSLGFANSYKKEAYVRQTAWPELNQYLMDHELEHLVESHATDEDENGIRHKGIGDIFKTYFQAIDPFNTVGSHGGAPFSGSGNALKGGVEGLLGSGGNPLGFVAGAEGSNLSGMGNKPAQPSSQPGGYQAQGPSSGFSGLFQQGNPQSSMGASAPSGTGPQGGQGAPMANIGLGAGLPNNANISMGQGAQQNQDQRQSGFWFPQYKF